MLNRNHRVEDATSRQVNAFELSDELLETLSAGRRVEARRSVEAGRHAEAGSDDGFISDPVLVTVDPG